MLKVSSFQGLTDQGPRVFPLFTKSDGVFEKTAAPSLLSEVTRYIETLRPQKGSQYILVNAMGAGEFWGSNINGDHFPEAALIHRPAVWMGNPVVDKIRAKDWPYGFPTFYRAHAYAHHQNKDSSRAYGEVELAAWNDGMKRVELIVRVDEEKCQRFGGMAVWDKLIQGQFADVSMGCRVPYDTCGICLDWKLYREAQATFKPGQHKHPGEAVLAFHKKLKAEGKVGIRGLSITRKDYCDHARFSMNKIFADGRKVFVYNDYPAFFDISFVFIGADKTAKVMLKVASEAIVYSLPSAEIAEKLGYSEVSFQSISWTSNPLPGYESEVVKTASADELFEQAFLGKSAKAKRGEIEKEVVPSQFVGKAIPMLNEHEEDIPSPLLDRLGHSPLEEALSTLSMLGIVLRPREFQKITLIQLGQSAIADDLDRKGIVFPESKNTEPMSLDSGSFNSGIAQLLAPLLMGRSAFGPCIERRVTVLAVTPPKEKKACSSLPADLLCKIGSAYNGYREELMGIISKAQDSLLQSGLAESADLRKIAEASAVELFTPLSVAYLTDAFWDEVGQTSSRSQ